MDALQRRVIQEDVVQYKLLLIQPDGSNSQQTEERLTHLVEEILAKCSLAFLGDVTQTDRRVSFSLTGDVPAHIGGSTQFGDNVEDEWFIVYLLQKITEAFPELAASVVDNDGEFLLIEAADYLPKWLNPDTSENRVFLCRGELHILPCPSKSSPAGISKDVVPSVAQALALLSTHPEACQANPKISSALRKRLEGYPEKIKTSLHRAHCFLPAGIATVLAQRPDLVAPAVSAFYLRDPIDLQACRSFKAFPPDTQVLTSAHGFEILCSKCRLPSSEPDAPVSCNPQWKGFMDSLKRNDYFRGELEGSSRYRDLTRSAENFFKQSVASKSSAPSPGEEVLQLLHSCKSFNLEELKKKESQLPPEDSDSWLDITAQDLERMLQERSGGRADVGSQNSASTKETQHEGAEERRKEKREEEEGAYSLVAVSQGMKNFLNAMSSHEGAEMPWCSSTQPFSFDPDSMANALDRLLGIKEEELDSDDLDDDDDDEDEEEEEEEEEEAAGSSGHTEMNGTEALDGLRKYMDQMDEELMSTNIGQSFSQTNHNKADLDNGSRHPSAADGLPAHGGPDETEEEIQPLDVDLNLVSNLLESLSCQAGLAGPASNLLQSLGLHIPPNSDPS
ncbi:Protein ecdysoneless-like protein [Nibea albiflora]|uniref:Protein ecdysoneless-like protein n=1 Tax=Nibea albiflora TaxID=240163 RepID=A0ACB7EDZ3_NIBAL|nr:Protein ecdysoneless-like protein [Nibea albiflora]